MPINKVGVTQKIRTVAVTEQEFEKLKEQIISTNNLMRCHKCGKLLAKVDKDLVSIKRKDIDIVANINSLSIKCPVCGCCNNACLEQEK